MGYQEGITQGQSESQAAFIAMEAFERVEIARVMQLLLSNIEHPIDPKRLANIEEQLNSSSTVKITEPEFTICRTANNGFRLDWHDVSSQLH